MTTFRKWKQDPNIFDIQKHQEHMERFIYNFVIHDKMKFFKHDENWKSLMLSPQPEPSQEGLFSKYLPQI